MQMNRSLNHPRDTVGKICGSGKILALAIFVGILLVISAVVVFTESPDFTNVELFGMEIDLSFIPYVGDILETATNIVFIFGLISLLPMALITVGLFMVRFGSSDKPMLVGLYLVKVALWLFALSELVTMVCYVFPLLFIAMALDIMIALPIYIVILIIVPCFSLRSLYFSSFSGMVGSAAETFRFGVNLTVRSGYVTFINWIFAIFNILLSLFDGPMSIICSVALGISLILANLCFGEYKKLCGTVKTNEKKQTLIAIASAPENADEIDKMGIAVNENGKLITTGFIKYTFGTYVLSPSEEKEPTYQAQTSPLASFVGQSQTYSEPNPGPRIYNHDSSNHTPSPLSYAPAPQSYTPAVRTEPQVSVAPAPFAQAEPKRESSAPAVLCLKGSPLKLFSSDVEDLAQNYEIIGKKKYKDEMAAPIAPDSAAVVFDSFSENKLLRMAWKNKSGYGIVSASFDLTFHDNCGRLIARMDGASFRSPSEVAPDEIAFAELGLPIPDDTFSGSVTVTRVEFSNGLFWSKPVEAISFEASESKRAYELSNSSFDMVLVSCIELQWLNFDMNTHVLEFAVKNIGDIPLLSYDLLVKARSGSYEENVSRVIRSDIRIMPGEIGELHKLVLPSQAIGGTIVVSSGIYENNAMEANLSKFNFGKR